MVIVNELPFKHVGGIGFKEVMCAACPQFRMPSRWTVSRDCYQLYLDERTKLKNLLRHNSSRICLTQMLGLQFKELIICTLQLILLIMTRI